MMDKILTYVRGRMTTHVIVNITIDPGLMGGMVVEYEGKHMEYSVRQIFDQMAVEEEKRAMARLAPDANAVAANAQSVADRQEQEVV
jgi:hypothetical protein